MRGFCVNIWGLRFYKKIVFGVCELQFKINSIFGVRILAYEKVDIWSFKVEMKLQKKAKF